MVALLKYNHMRSFEKENGSFDFKYSFKSNQFQIELINH